MADHQHRLGDLDRLSAFVKQREKRNFIYTVAAISVASLFAILLIAFSAKYSYDAFQKVADAKQQVRDLEAVKGVLETDIVNKRLELQEITSKLEKVTKLALSGQTTSGADPAITQQLISDADAAAKQAAQGSRLVYLQFRGALSRDTMRGLQSILQDKEIFGARHRAHWRGVR